MDCDHVWAYRGQKRVAADYPYTLVTYFCTKCLTVKKVAE